LSAFLKTVHTFKGYLARRIDAFRHVFRGGAVWFRKEAHARLHLGAAVIAVVISLWMQIGWIEWALIFIAISLVWIAEIFNTVVERLADVLQPEKDLRIQNIKDMSALAVSIAALNAVVIAVLVWLR